MKSEMLELTKWHIEYLRSGAFENISIEDDIRLCSNALEKVYAVFDALHNSEIEKVYINCAEKYKKAFRSNAGDYGIKTASCMVLLCELVIRAPNETNWRALCDAIDELHPDMYDIVQTNNEEQNRIHRRLYRALMDLLPILEAYS